MIYKNDRMLMERSLVQHKTVDLGWKTFQEVPVLAEEKPPWRVPQWSASDGLTKSDLDPTLI